MKRSCIFIQTMLLRAMLSVLIATSLASAQKAPPQDQPFYRIKPSEASEKTNVNAPQRFEKEGIAIPKPTPTSPARRRSAR